MTAQEKLGAMYSLVHKKTNLMGQIKVMGERLEESIAAHPAGEDVDGLLEAVKARGEKIKEIEQLNRQIAFLEESGYQPSEDEARRIALEQGTMRALAELITKLNDKLAEGLRGIQADFMESLREVREGQRSIQAYFPLPEEEEGRQVDTLR